LQALLIPSVSQSCSKMQAACCHPGTCRRSQSVHSPNPALQCERRIVILALAGAPNPFILPILLYDASGGVIILALADAPNPFILPILLYDASGVLSSWRLQGTIDLTTRVSPVGG
jgi:hypothetical protein